MRIGARNVVSSLALCAVVLAVATQAARAEHVGSAHARGEELALPVPRGTIYPGEVVGNEHLVNRAFIAHTVSRAAVFEVRDHLVGKVARRTLLPGQPIPVNAIRDAFLVVQGKSTTVVFASDGLIITSQATALQNGGVGELVSLRNNDSGNVIKGTVAADGTVRVASQ